MCFGEVPRKDIQKLYKIGFIDFHTTVTKRSLFGYLFLFTDFKNPNIAKDTAISKVARLMGHPAQILHLKFICKNHQN